MLKSTGKKSQLEIVGLVVIVILISLALLFYLQFSLRSAPEIKKTYTNSQLASNMVNALLETSTECDGNTIATLLSDCAMDFEGSYTTGGNLHCETAKTELPDSCIFVENTIQNLLGKTLNKWNVKYQLNIFLISDPENPVKYFSNEFDKCLGNIEAQEYPVPVKGRGLMLVRLNVCAD
ncbi:hypothetical protein KY317_00670 [Candidatus Woesearchaeota archaeon]|nr:hypothetical protein [Candidatus Woesearchaeota archaeon]